MQTLCYLLRSIFHPFSFSTLCFFEPSKFALPALGTGTCPLLSLQCSSTLGILRSSLRHFSKVTVQGWTSQKVECYIYKVIESVSIAVLFFKECRAAWYVCMCVFVYLFF